MTRYKITKIYMVEASSRIEARNRFTTAVGQKVYAEGRLHSHTWTANNGEQKHATEIILSDMTLLDKKPEDVAVPMKLVSPADGEQVGTTQL
jgi:single-stranded DNA-binding protein